ncbi:MAG: Ig domain-containing protein, partial [Gaiellaceae bacterium]|nr:Ig domain-containing protein [Gaiellaceae bacterium]
PEVTFSADWGANDELHLEIGAGIQGELGGAFSATGSVVCEATFTFLDGVSLGKKLIFVGPVPVVVEPKLSLAAKLSGKAEASLATTASATGSFSGLLTLDRAPGSGDVAWSFEPSRNLQGSLDLGLEGKLEATFSLTPSIGFLLYGVVAPTASLSSGLKAAYEPCARPNLTLRQPVALAVGLKPSKWLGKMLEPLRAIDVELGTTFNFPGSPYLLYASQITTTIPCVELEDLPDGQVGVPYSARVRVPIPSTATDPTYTVTDGSLPPGLELTGDGVLEGVPTQSGIYRFRATATHSLGTSTGAFRVTIQPAETLAITTTSLPGGRVGQAYSFTLQANRPAGELTWALTGGDLPPGIELSADGALSGTPSEAGAYPVTIEATHAPSAQTAEKLFTVTVIEDVGGAVLGETYGEPAVDIRPDGSAAAILTPDVVEDAFGNRLPQTWRLVKAGPDGEVDFTADLPSCTDDVLCYGAGWKSAVRVMPDGGAVVALMLDGRALIARYRSTGEKLWERSLAQFDAPRIRRPLLAVAPDGRIAVAGYEFFERDRGIFCDELEQGAVFAGTEYVELDAAGETIRERRFETTATCAAVEAGLGATQTHVTGLAVAADGHFVAVGYRDHLGQGNYPGAPLAPPIHFRSDLDTIQVLAVPDGKRLAGLAASGDGLYVAVGTILSSDWTSPVALGGLDGTSVTVLAAPLTCGIGITGLAGVPGSLLEVCGNAIARLSDEGALVASRTFSGPFERTLLGAVAGAGGQVFTVESRIVAEDGYYPQEIARRVLNPDLTDPD